MANLAQHPVRWQSPQPLWTRLPTHGQQARPALLRFASDDFMDQLLATLARDPAALDQRLARWESWRQPITEAPDAVARAPLPQLAQSALRSRFAAKGKKAIAEAVPEAQPLKLYQAAHQRYYIATASLVCGIHGLPDRALTAGGSEEVGFVLRRLMPVPATAAQPAGLREFAFLKDANGARWQRCSEGVEAATLVADEERLPAFALRFQDDGGRVRALWSGLVPVGRREEYLGAKVVATPAPAFAEGQRQSLEPAAAAAPDSVRARMVQFQMDVSEPWKTLIRASAKLQDDFATSGSVGGDSESVDAKRQRAYVFNLAQASASWLVLLDCADHIDTHLHDLWQVLQAHGSGYNALSAPRKKLYDFLSAASMSPGLALCLRRVDSEAPARPTVATMRDALLAMRQSGVREALEAATISYNLQTLAEPPWPSFHFVLAGLSNALLADGPYTLLGSAPYASPALGAESTDPVAGSVPGQAQALWVDHFTALFAQALDPQPVQAGPALPYAAQVAEALWNNAADLGDGGTFVLRYVYLRRDCGPLHPPVLSAPSEHFRLASFFDADAPARPIRISLPVDVSPAGLRKFNRNTAFVMSDMLCGQVQRAKGMGLGDLVRSVLPWPLHKDLDVGSGGPCQSGGNSIGMICSLSIPIITICALILLMIIVSLLDLVFRWMPYFVMCFPVPGLKGKKGGAP